MELREYIRTKRQWLVPFLVVPVLAGMVVAVLLIMRPDYYGAQVRVQVPATEANSDSQIGLYTARFAQAVQFGGLLQPVAAEAGVDVAELRSGLSVARVAQSDLISVSLVGPWDADTTLAAAEAVARAGLVRLTESDAGTSLVELDAAAQAVSDAQLALLDYQASIGSVDPAAAYQAVSAALQTAQSQLISDQAAGDAEGAQIAQTQIDSLQAQRDQLVGQLRQVNILQAQVAGAKEQLANSQQRFVSYQTRLAAAKSDNQIISSSVAREPRIRPVIEGAGVAFLLAFLAVLGISLLPDILRRQRREGQHRRLDAAGAEYSASDALPEPGPSVKGTHAPPSGLATEPPVVQAVQGSRG